MSLTTSAPNYARPLLGSPWATQLPRIASSLQDSVVHEQLRNVTDKAARMPHGDVDHRCLQTEAAENADGQQRDFLSGRCVPD